MNLAPCPDVPYADGCSAPGVVWLSPSVADQALLLHELGHQLDYAQPGWARARFERLSGDRRPWASEPNGPAEQFAEAWMGCAAPSVAAQRYDSATGSYEFAYDYRPTWKVLRRTCRLIRQAASASMRRAPAPLAAPPPA